jgi:hypothetical protein
MIVRDKKVFAEVSRKLKLLAAFPPSRRLRSLVLVWRLYSMYLYLQNYLLL